MLLLVNVIVPTFAEENGTILGTFGVGYTGLIDINLTAISFDIDLISNKGLAVSFGYMTNFNIDYGIFNIGYIGLGYRYLANYLDYGISVIVVPLEYWDCLAGIKLNSGLWFTDNVGLSLAVMAGYGVTTGIVAFSIRPGISVKIK